MESLSHFYLFSEIKILRKPPSLHRFPLRSQQLAMLNNSRAAMWARPWLQACIWLTWYVCLRKARLMQTMHFMRWALCSPYLTVWDIDSAKGHFKLNSICNTHNLAQSCSELFGTFLWEKASLTKGLKTYVWNTIIHIFHFSQFPCLSHPTNFQLTPYPSSAPNYHPSEVICLLKWCWNNINKIFIFDCQITCESKQH